MIALSGLTSGNAVEGTQVTATETDPNAPASGITYTWQVNGSTVKTGVDAAGNTYTPGENDEGKPISVSASYTDVHASPQNDSASAGTVQESPTENAAISFQDLVNGKPVEGHDVIADVVDPDAPANGIGITYTWKVNGVIVWTGTNDTHVTGHQTYVPNDADEGKLLTVTVSFTDTHGSTETGTATAGIVQEIANENATISGLFVNPVEGKPLTATVTDPDAPASGITYTWKVDDFTTVLTGVDGAGRTYTPTEADEGQFLELHVSFTDTNGNAETGSQFTGLVQENPTENAAIMVSGLVNGHAQETKPLTATVTDPDAPASGITYTWTSNGTVVSGGVDAPGNTYVPTQFDDGHTIAVSVSFKDSNDFAESGTTIVGTGVAFTRLAAGDYDTDGDKNGDLLWPNADGSIVTWDMNGAQISGQTTLGQIPSNWHFAGTGNFDPSFNGASGNTDALFTSDSGQVLIWQIVNNHVVTNSVVGQVPANWHFAGIGDVNGDGKSDVLWQSDAGAVLEWQMNGTHVVVNQVIGQAPGEHVLVVADFNQDGKADILLGSIGGRVDMWLMNGTQIVTNTSPGQVPGNWHFAATGDFNGDGNPDILFRSDAGGVLMWEMNGTHVLVNQFIGQVPANWHISGTADVNGDGKSDVIWTSDAGAQQLWEMNGTQVIADQPIGTNSPPASPPLNAHVSAGLNSAMDAAMSGADVPVLNLLGGFAHDPHVMV